MSIKLTFWANTLIIGLFLYCKLLPFKDKLNDKYIRVFNFFDSIFTPVLNFLKRFIKPFQVGQGLSVDLTHIIILIVLLILLNLCE